MMRVADVRCVDVRVTTQLGGSIVWLSPRGEQRRAFPITTNERPLRAASSELGDEAPDF